jgi:hypothetical protein
MEIEIKELKEMIAKAEGWSRYKTAKDTEEAFWNDGINTFCKHLEHLIKKKEKEMKVNGKEK